MCLQILGNARALWCAVGMSRAWVKFFFWSYLLFLVWADGTVTNPADPDLWHLLPLGEAFVKTGHFPRARRPVTWPIITR